MNRSQRALILTTQVLLLSVAAAGCDVPPSADGEKEAPVLRTAALTEPFTTPAQAQLATAVGSDRVFNVWLGQTATGLQVVGQMFDFAGASLGPARVYTSTTHDKFTPSVAYDGVGKFLIAYGDRYSQTDDDILGIIVDSTGALVTTSLVDFTTAFDQQANVIYVGGAINKWLVTYQRNPSAGNRLVLSVYIDAAGARGTSGTIVSDPNLEITPQAAYSTATGRLLYAWSLGNGNLQLRGSSTAFAVGGVSTIPLAAGHMYEYLSLVYQPNTSAFGLAWLEEEPFIDSGRAVRLRTFASGCEKLACANAEQPTMITTSATITDVNGPRLTALGQVFVIHNGQGGPNLPNGRNIKFTSFNASGVVSTINTSFVPACSTNLTDKLGLQYFLQAASNSTASRTNIFYDAFCPTTTVVRGQLETTTFSRTSYTVSN
jgi:hypothetical protein